MPSPSPSPASHHQLRWPPTSGKLQVLHTRSPLAASPRASSSSPDPRGGFHPGHTDTHATATSSRPHSPASSSTPSVPTPTVRPNARPPHLRSPPSAHLHRPPLPSVILYRRRPSSARETFHALAAFFLLRSKRSHIHGHIVQEPSSTMPRCLCHCLCPCSCPCLAPKPSVSPVRAKPPCRATCTSCCRPPPSIVFLSVDPRHSQHEHENSTLIRVVHLSEQHAFQSSTTLKAFYFLTYSITIII